MGKTIGVINEQGFPCGQFGFESLNENDKQKLKDANKDEKKKK